MITNLRQHRITRSALRKMGATLVQVDEQNADLDPLLRTAMRQQLESQIEELRDELAVYQQTHNQRVTARTSPRWRSYR